MQTFIFESKLCPICNFKFLSVHRIILVDGTEDNRTYLTTKYVCITIQYIIKSQLCSFVFVYAPGCKQGQFECGSGECVLLENRCDSYMDCEDGTDEDSCGRW